MKMARISNVFTGYWHSFPFKSVPILSERTLVEKTSKMSAMGSGTMNDQTDYLKATITRCDLSPRFFCIDATLLCEFESNKI